MITRNAPINVLIVGGKDQPHTRGATCPLQPAMLLPLRLPSVSLVSNIFEMLLPLRGGWPLYLIISILLIRDGGQPQREQQIQNNHDGQSAAWTLLNKNLATWKYCLNVPILDTWREASGDLFF